MPYAHVTFQTISYDHNIQESEECKAPDKLICVPTYI